MTSYHVRLLKKLTIHVNFLKIPISVEIEVFVFFLFFFLVNLNCQRIKQSVINDEGGPQKNSLLT